MPNVPIVTEVTKAELDALVTANLLNEGLQYKVTDKDWLLTATGNASLYSVVIKLIAPDTLPSYINCETLLIDCTVDVDTSTLHYIVPIPTGYYFILAIMPESGPPYFSSTVIQDGDENILIPDISGQPSVAYPLNADGLSFFYITDSIHLVQNNGANIIGSRIIFKFGSVASVTF